MKDFLSNNKLNILLYIVIGLLIWNIFNTSSIKTDVKGYKNRIELLQTKIDSAKVVDENITNKIDSVKEKVVTISKEINYIDKNLIIVKKQTDEKVNNIDKLSNIELEQFFTSRYNQNNITQ
jgi:hypothetical protein